MSARLIRRAALLAATASIAASSVQAQATAPTAAHADTTSTRVVTPQLDFSGIIFGNLAYRGDSAGGNQNAFNIDRVYLNFRMPAGERASIRVTTDIFQQTSAANNANAYYKGWAVRAKYAYLQYNFFTGAPNPNGFATHARIGLLQTVMIDHVDQFWPRYLGVNAFERAGFFPSADAGIATTTTLPNKWGEIYATVVNGPGYTSNETDRFKDYAARVSITPLARGTSFFKTLVITPFAYKGATASQFVNGGAGQVGPIGGGLAKDRYGVFVGLKDPRLTLGGIYGQRSDDVESGANTVAAPRTVTNVKGKLFAGFGILKPFQFMNAKSTVPLSIIGRLDAFKPDADKDPNYHFVTAGLIWDLNKKASLAFDYQEMTNRDGLTGQAPHTYFVHWVANF